MNLINNREIEMQREINNLTDQIDKLKCEINIAISGVFGLTVANICAIVIISIWGM